MPHHLIFDENHLAKLNKVREAYDRSSEVAASRTGSDWYNKLKLPYGTEEPAGIKRLISKPKRDELFKLVDDSSVSTLSLCAAIFAWGGMRASHGRMLFRQPSEWCAAADILRSCKLTRGEAYKLLHDLRLKKLLPGMGPAYFTKLIFFLRGPNVKDMGYIMDQWTGCSVNVLTSDPCKISMDVTCTWTSAKKVRSDFRVSDQNNDDRYEQFCCAIDQLSKELSLDRMDTELLLMSHGRGQGDWRKYVIAKRQAVTVTASRSV